jgi:hypothetical protein
MDVVVPTFTIDDIEGEQAHTLPCPPESLITVEHPFAQEQYNSEIGKEVKRHRTKHFLVVRLLVVLYRQASLRFYRLEWVMCVGSDCIRLLKDYYMRAYISIRVL